MSRSVGSRGAKAAESRLEAAKAETDSGRGVKLPARNKNQRARDQLGQTQCLEST